MIKSAQSVSIKLWLPLLIAGLTTLVWAAMTWQEFVTLKTNLVNSSERSIKQDMILLQHELEAEFREGHLDEAERAVTTRGVNSNYIRLAVTDEQARIRYSIQFADKGKSTQDVFSEFEMQRFDNLQTQRRADIWHDESNSYFIVYYPVTLEQRAGEIRSQFTGAIFLVFDYKNELNAIWHTLWRTSLLKAVILFVALAVLFVFSHIFIARPIDSLVETSREIAAGKYGVTCNVSGCGEFKQLGEAINQMSERIRVHNERRDRAASLLRSKERWQRQLLDTLPNGVQENDAYGLISYSNAAHHRILGLKQGELIGCYVWDFQPDDEKKQEIRDYLAYLVKEQPMPMPYITTNITSDGDEVTLDINWDYQRNDADEVTGFISVVTDISKRVAAEAALQESENRYRSLFEKTADALLIIEGERFIDCNAATLAMLGYPDKAAFLNVHPAELSPDVQPDGRRSVEKANAMMKIAYAEGSHRFEWQHRRSNGEVFPVEVLLTAIPVSGKQILHVVWRDIAQRYRAERALIRSEQAYRGLFENAEVAIYNEDMSAVYSALIQLREQGVVDLRQYLKSNQSIAWDIAALVRVINVNEAALQLFAADDEDILLQQIQKTFGDDAIDVFIEELCAIWDCKRAFRSEAEFINFEGKSINAIVSFQIPETAEGFSSIPVGIIDITERKQVEKALRRSQKMDAIGQLTGGIAHDFNNIISIIMGNLSLLEKQNELGEKAQKRVDTIKHSAQRAADLTRQLLGFSSERPSSIKVTDVNLVIKQSQGLITQSLTPQVEIEYQCADDIWLTEIDSGDLEDALINLTLNARDAMNGRGKLTIETNNSSLDESYCLLNPDVTPGDYVRISISDNGNGIVHDLQDRIFEPFFTTKEQGKGTGLGLAMVFGFVKRSAGHIKLYSEPEIGTTFRLYLPRVIDGQHSVVDVRSQDSVLPQGQETILVVDDEVDLLELVEVTLQQQGYRVITAYDGNTALEKLAQHDIDLLFTDVVMPGGLNGYELAEQAVKQYPSLKVLLTSGYTEKAVARNGQARLNANLLSKPYTQTELARWIRDTLT